tara:strand:+ start:2420 stop:2728 length:309 start_codon:yes stop_codon:yes gene_type:complete
MSPEEQRIAIAEACGWTDVASNYEAYLPNAQEPSDYAVIPDYLNDLTAMHEAEKVLKTNCEMQRYLDNLRTVCRCMVHGEGTITATAAQRAEAFRTLNRWKD